MVEQFPDDTEFVPRYIQEPLFLDEAHFDFLADRAQRSVPITQGFARIVMGSTMQHELDNAVTSPGTKAYTTEELRDIMRHNIIDRAFVSHPKSISDPIGIPDRIGTLFVGANLGHVPVEAIYLAAQNIHNPYIRQFVMSEIGFFYKEDITQRYESDSKLLDGDQTDPLDNPYLYILKTDGEENPEKINSFTQTIACEQAWGDTPESARYLIAGEVHALMSVLHHTNYRSGSEFIRVYFNKRQKDYPDAVGYFDGYRGALAGLYVGKQLDAHALRLMGDITSPKVVVRTLVRIDREIDPRCFVRQDALGNLLRTFNNPEIILDALHQISLKEPNLFQKINSECQNLSYLIWRISGHKPDGWCDQASKAFIKHWIAPVPLDK